MFLQQSTEITEISLTKSFYHTYYHHLTKFTPMFWRVSEEDRGEVVEADQHALDPGQQEDLVLPSENLAIRRY